MTIELPNSPQAITAEWLQAALQERHPGTRVDSVEVLGEQGATNHHSTLQVQYSGPTSAPSKLFCKMASLDEGLRAAIGATGMGAREVRFYNEIAPGLSMRTPACSYASTGADGWFLILLEDLNESACRTSDGTWGLTPDQAADGLRSLGELHRTYERADAFAAVAPWINETPPGNIPFTTMMMRHVIDEHHAILGDEYVAIGEMYIDQPEAVVSLWSHGPHTVVHGDAHLGNTFLDGDRVGFLDWGLLATAPAVRDVSYFVSLQLMPEDRREHERELIAGYLAEQRSHGTEVPTIDEAWELHRVHAGYLVLASFLSLVPPYNNPENRAFADAFRGRAIAAVEDLGTADALRRALAG